MSPEQRRQYIETLRDFPPLLEDAVAGLSDGQLDTPYGPGKWTIRQVVHHLADSHANGFARVRWILTEDCPAIKPYAQDEWARLTDAMNMPIEASLWMLRGLHARMVYLLQSLSEEQWSRGMNHPESGLVKLESWLAVYAGHCDKHLGHITGLRKAKGW